MKKLFSLVAAAVIAISSASAEILWSEPLYKADSTTCVNKNEFKGYWPYVNQWYQNGHLRNEYTNVSSLYATIRNKAINGAAENTIGIYFGANKAAASCYVTFEGTIYTAAEGNYLKFEISSPESGSAEEIVTTKLSVSINDETLASNEAIVVPATNKTVTVSYALPAGDITKLSISFDNVSTQKFITDLRIEDEATAIDNTEVSVKAVKQYDAELGQVVIIRNGVKYNALGVEVGTIAE